MEAKKILTILNMAADLAGSIIRNNEELRIVMMGKTGVEKSASGNTILGRHCFESELAAWSTTVGCAKGTAMVDGQKVVVIDTPGLFDLRFGMDKTSQDITQCISYASPGPHIFLVVIRLGRYTEEEQQTVQKIKEIFGQSADRYSMVLFTGGDLLEGTIEELLRRSQSLQDLIAKCHGQYHVFNNKSKDHAQVTELIQKIRNVVQKNGGSHYTNEMFQEAERAIETEKQRILKEDEEKIQREKEEMEREIQRKHNEEMDNMKQEFQAERKRERKEREEEWKRERQEMIEERKREMAEIHEERRREREENQRQMTWMMEQMREQHKRQMSEGRRFQEQKEAEARAEREEERRRERQEMNEKRRREREETWERKFQEAKGEAQWRDPSKNNQCASS